MKYLILGASAAGVNAARAIREKDKKAEITIISLDSKTYSRCMLHLYVGKSRSLESLNFVDKNFFKNNGINWVKSTEIVKISPETKTVYSSIGKAYDYDKLLIATGSSAVMPAIKTIDSQYQDSKIPLLETKNTFVLRTLEDADKIDDMANRSRTAVVIGGGLIGIDIATELMGRGLQVHIIEAASRILSLQLDVRASMTYEVELKKRGAKISCNKLVSRAVVDEHNFVKGLFLSDGTVLEADMVIVAAGTKPNDDLVENTKIQTDRGIIVNSMCETHEKDIFAAGDVLAGKANIWSLATKEGITAAHNMMGIEKHTDSVHVLKNSFNFFGIETISLGLTEPPDEFYEVDFFDDGVVYKKVVHKLGIIVGAVFQNDISYVGTFTTLISKKINVAEIKKNVLDLNYADFFKTNENAEFEFNQ